MKNGKDFIYEFSDLNLLHTRVKILTGKYKGLIFEFGGSGLMEWIEDGKYKNKFDFTYALYEIPKTLTNSKLEQNPEFEKFLMYLIIDVIGARNTDPEWKIKLEEAASVSGVQNSKIKISEKHYADKLMAA